MPIFSKTEGQTDQNWERGSLLVVVFDADSIKSVKKYLDGYYARYLKRLKVRQF